MQREIGCEGIRRWTGGGQACSLAESPGVFHTEW